MCIVIVRIADADSDSYCRGVGLRMANIARSKMKYPSNVCIIQAYLHDLKINFAARRDATLFTIDPSTNIERIIAATSPKLYKIYFMLLRVD